MVLPNLVGGYLRSIALILDREMIVTPEVVLVF